MFRAFEQYVPPDMRADLQAAHRISAVIVGCGVMRVLGYALPCCYCCVHIVAVSRCTVAPVACMHWA